METLNIQCIEQQQVLITLTLTDSDGAPVDLTRYAVYAASVGAVDPYCRRAARLEWAAAINNECSAFIITAPGHDIARAPWKYQICIKNRQLGLEWAVVSGRVELTPRTCGTDGIAPASYTVACEATPSGLVNVTLDATVGSISTTLEQVKASAASAAAAAQNAHADLEDAETAASKASQAALAAAADARIASDKATAAEAAATAAPEACKPYVQQVQQAAAQALDASRAAATAAAGAQASADAAAPAQGYATRADEAKTAAVQAAGEATTAATTATEQAAVATSQAESARLAATTASTASDNAQAEATRAEDAATRAEAATSAATRAEAARDAAEAAASTATTAAADVPGLVQRAETAATASEAAQTAAESAQGNAESAATTATEQAEAAAASATQADTDARACAVFAQRCADNKAATDAAATSASNSATSAAAAEAAVSTAAENYEYDELYRMVNVAAAAYGIMQSLDTAVDYISEPIIGGGRYRLQLKTTSEFVPADIIVSNSTDSSTFKTLNCRVLYAPKINGISSNWGNVITQTDKPIYLHMPTIKHFHYGILGHECKHLIFSPSTNFDYLESAVNMLPTNKGTKVTWAPNTTMPRLTSSERLFYKSKVEELPDGITFEKLKSFERCFYQSAFVKLPSGMVMVSAENCDRMFYGATQMEIEDIVRVCSTIKDLQALPTPKTANLGLPITCKHNGENVTCDSYINAYYPDFIATMQARGWNVSFGNS